MQPPLDSCRRSPSSPRRKTRATEARSGRRVARVRFFPASVAFGVLATAAVAAAAVNPKALPLGDGHVSSSPRVGYVDSCQTSFGGRGGAQAAGPWIDSAAGTWDRTAK